MRFTNILIGLDGSAFDRAVIDAAVTLASCGVASPEAPMVRIVSVVDTSALAAADGGMPEPMTQALLLEQEAAACLETARAAFPPSIRVATEMLRGSPTRELVHLAQSWPAQLVVLGSHGRSGVARLLVGSVAESVLRHVTCPVLVVRQPDHASA